MFCAAVGAAVMALSTARQTSVLGMTVPRRRDTCFDAWRPRKVAAGGFPPPRRGCKVDGGRRSPPHPIHPPPTGGPLGEKGAGPPVALTPAFLAPPGGPP